MNYLTGMALGISAGRQVNQFIKSDGFSLVHTLPGRRRYTHDDLLQNKELAAQWQAHLAAIRGIVKAQANPQTGTILVEYSCPDEYVDLVMDYLHKLHNMPGPRSAYGKLGMDIRRLGKRLNRSLFRESNRTLDLRTIAAISMLLVGGAKIWNQGQRPSGPQMVWWAYSLLKGGH